MNNKLEIMAIFAAPALLKSNGGYDSYALVFEQAEKNYNYLAEKYGADSQYHRLSDQHIRLQNTVSILQAENTELFAYKYKYLISNIKKNDKTAPLYTDKQIMLAELESPVSIELMNAARRTFNLPENRGMLFSLNEILLSHFYYKVDSKISSDFLHKLGRIKPHVKGSTHK